MKMQIKKCAEKMIVETFLELLKTIPIEKITVSQIVKIANLNRRTFYDYFYGKDELIHQLDKEVLQEFQGIFGDFTIVPIENSFLLVEKGEPLPHNIAICQHIQQHQHYYQIRFKDDTFMQKFTSIIENYLAHFSNNQGTNSYLAHGTTGFLRQWLNSNCTKPCFDIARDLGTAGFYSATRDYPVVK